MHSPAVLPATLVQLSLGLLLLPSCGGSDPTGPGPDPQPGGGFVVDHLCTDISEIPGAWVDSAQAGLFVHYAHTSHGSQLVTGL